MYEKLDLTTSLEKDRWGESLSDLEELGFLNVRLARLFSAEEPELYEQIVRAFLASDLPVVLQGHYEKEEWAQYRYVLCTLKSDLKLIGAESLFLQAKAMESLVRNEDYGKARIEHDRLMAACAELVGRLKARFPGEYVVDCWDEQDSPVEVLLVDDDAANVFAARYALSPYFDMACLRTGQEALEYVRSHTPELILVDTKLSDMSGFDVMKALTERESTRNIPVMFWSADEDATVERDSLKAGVQDYIRKPFVPDILMHRVYRTLEMGRLKGYLQKQVQKSASKIDTLSIQVAVTLARTIDAKDPYTKGHSDRVAEYSSKLARKMGLPAEEQSRIYYIGLLHDIGKIGVPDYIIAKPGRLTEDEYAAVKKHPGKGYDILKGLNEIQGIEQGARWHHEWMDGTGYPDGLQGGQIPLLARIISVADAYDAMNSRRSYRNALPKEQIVEELETGKGKQFDPEIAQIAIEMIQNGEI